MFFVSSGIIISEASSSELMVDDWFTNLDQFPPVGKNEDIWVTRSFNISILIEFKYRKRGTMMMMTKKSNKKTNMMWSLVVPPARQSQAIESASSMNKPGAIVIVVKISILRNFTQTWTKWQRRFMTIILLIFLWNPNAKYGHDIWALNKIRSGCTCSSREITCIFLVWVCVCVCVCMCVCVLDQYYKGVW